MKQPDTSALRERLASYTPEQELEQDTQKLRILLEEIDSRTVELRDLLNKISTVKEELHVIHDSLMHTAKRERAAFTALSAAKDSADNIVNGICNAIVKAEQQTVIQAHVGTDELEKVSQCSANHIKAEEKLLENHRNRLARHLHDNEGIWLSDRWLKILLVVQLLCYLAVVLWVLMKR